MTPFDVALRLDDWARDKSPLDEKNAHQLGAALRREEQWLTPDNIYALRKIEGRLAPR